jgi:hypothetical protein
MVLNDIPASESFAKYDSKTSDVCLLDNFDRIEIEPE